MILSLLFLSLAIACRSVVELWNHGKLKWSKEDDSFWGEHSHTRKYANPLDAPKDNWYYRFFKIGSLEKWPTSATFTVMFTDGAHMCQALFMLSLGLSVSFALTFSWWTLAGVWALVHGVHFTAYKLLSR
jgi:hypothetical protein